MLSASRSFSGRSGHHAAATVRPLPRLDEVRSPCVSYEWSDIFCAEGASSVTLDVMTGMTASPATLPTSPMSSTLMFPTSPMLIGYARCSTDGQDLAAQEGILAGLGVAQDRLYTDRGFTGTSRARPGLDQALAALRTGDTLVVPKLDRLARSVPDARAIADGLAARGVRLQLGAAVHDPTDPMGRLFFNILATFAEFEADLIRMRTREGMAVARAKGRLRGKAPKLSDRQQKELRRMHATGGYTISDLGAVFGVSRPTVYRTLTRQAVA